MIKRASIRLLRVAVVVFILTTILTGNVGHAAQKDITPSGIDVSNLSSEIEKYVEEHKDTTAAVSIAVFHNDKTIHEGYYGYGDIETGLVNSSETVMEWGSITKLLVWVSVIQLVENGEIDLGADIGIYLPEGFLSNLKYNQPITMMNLMHHNAGLEEQLIELFVPIDKEVDDLKDVLKNTMPNQIYKPQSVVAYSNWGVALAGYIVERVSGMSFSDYVHKYIFEPLGMEHTAILPTLEDNLWVNEQRDYLKCYTTDLIELGPSRYQIALYPAGMATGTLDDLLLFGKAMVPKEDEELKLFKKQETLDAFLSPSLFYHDENSSPRNAHGLWIDNTEIMIFGHGGNTYGASANLQFDPISGIGLAVMTNQSGEVVYNNGLQEMIFGKYPEASKGLYEYDISGVYTQSRSIKTGGLRLYSFFLTMPILPGNENNYYVPLMGMNITPINSDRILIDYGSIVGSGFVVRNENNTATLEIGTQDFLPKNTVLYIFEIFLLIIMVLAFIYSIYILIRLLVRKLGKKPLEAKTVEIILMSIGNLGLLVSFLYTAMNALNFGTSNNIRLGLILCAGFSIWILFFFVRSAIHFRESDNNKIKRRIIKTSLSCLAMLLNSFYWQWFMFW